MDGGIEKAREVVERLYTDLWPKNATKVRRKDFKTKLQEATQRISKGLPVYALEDSSRYAVMKLF